MRRIRRLFSFFGRATRREYWLIAVPVNIGLFGGLFGLDYLYDHKAEGVATILALLSFPPLIWLNLAIAVRRLHDRNMSGVWVVPLYGGVVALGMVTNELPPSQELMSELAAFGMLGLLILGVVLLGILPGGEGPNRHGGGVDGRELAQAFD